VRQADRKLSGSVPLEESSGNRRRLGQITKQGNVLLRFLLVGLEASFKRASRNFSGSV
jgi:transposase